MAVVPKHAATIRDHLGPEPMAEDVFGSLQPFLARHGDTQFLLVRLKPGLEALESTLASTQRSGGQRVVPSIRVMSYETEALTQDQVLELELGDRSEEARIRRFRSLLRAERHFVMPLRKRTSEPTFMDRVSLGRAPNKDLVLRHAHVSKFHAWFEMDELAALYVADADSRNGTWLNGRKLAPRELTRVASGDQLRFGPVECIAAAPRELWHAVHD